MTQVKQKDWEKSKQIDRYRLVWKQYCEPRLLEIIQRTSIDLYPAFSISPEGSGSASENHYHRIAKHHDLVI